ncbi:LptF/LptG family permease [Mucisphaera calidilacus]|uniref:Putative permease YjgP/YjgQ family protein n=1 Tax=Mucisphaera calidilacus TaxID=2527982 RepID=A0A518BWB7_9BACT|nr:LptF/LptG family permease [Mucisphaera calidilacus]QDU71267.1 putative permease YjgP/YjgQ family protein [Mucisphaera calidilacus]
MTILDRYILRQFFQNFVILLSVLIGLFVLIDLILNIDEFVEAGRVMADRWGGQAPATMIAIADYYWPLAVLALVHTVGLIAIGAAGFTLVAMHRNRELVALAASGMSLHRVAAPILVGSILLSLFTLPLQEAVIPDLATKLTRGASEVKNEALNAFPIRLIPDEDGTLFTASSFNITTGRLTDVSILERDSTGMMLQRIVGDAATWNHRRGGWEFEPTAFAASPIGTSSDVNTPVARDPQPVVFYATEMSPTIILARRKALFKRLLSMGDLQTLESSAALAPRERAEITQIIWSRFSLLVVHVLVVAIGIPFFLLRSPANIMTQSVRAAILCIGCWATALVLLQSSSGYNPVAMAWLPAALGLPIATFMLHAVET